MVIGIDVELKGSRSLRRLLKSIEDRGGDLSPAFKGPINKSVTLLLRRQFASKGAISGPAWAALRPATKEARQRRGGNRGGIDHPLWDTGRLKASLEKVGPDSFLKITPDSYERGSTLFYAALHQEGFTVKQWGGRRFSHARRVPARKPVPDPVPKAVLRTWEKIIASYLEKGKS